MVMDQAGWHLAGGAGESAADLPAALQSPALHPSEHRREALREECFANPVFADLDALERALSAGLRALEADPVRVSDPWPDPTGWRRYL